MATRGTEAHVDHTVALGALQLLIRLVLPVTDIHGNQLTLTHGAEANFFVAVGTRDAPIGAGEIGPFLGISHLHLGPMLKHMCTNSYRSERVLYTSGSTLSRKGMGLYVPDPLIVF